MAWDPPLTGNFLVKALKMEMTVLTRDFLVEEVLLSKTCEDIEREARFLCECFVVAGPVNFMLCCELTRRTQQTKCVQRWYVATVAQVSNVKSIFGNRMEIWYVLLWPLLAWRTFWRHFAIILIPFQFHFEFIMVSFWYHFAVSLNSLWYHFGFILVSVWYHFVSILVTFWYHFEGIRQTTKIGPL